MRLAGNGGKGRAPLRGGALPFLLALLAVGLWIAPASAQSTGQKTPPTKKPGSTSASSKSTSKKKTSSRRSRRSRGQAKPTSERIREIQAAMARAGHYSGETSGAWDNTSVSALKRFQESKGLKPTGKLDARSLQLLGLGSETAGLAPPRESAASAADSSSRQ